MKCEHCGSKDFVRKGIRKLVSSSNQRYKCTNCGKQFSFKKGRFDSSLILDAVCSYNSGKSLAKTAEIIQKTSKANVSLMTISRWVKKHGASFRKNRNRLMEKYKNIDAISSKQFVHSGLIFNYSLHNWKLNEFCNYESLKKYLRDLDEWINKYFSSGKRCSQITSVSKVDVIEKKNLLCSAAEFAISACNGLRERHSLVQKHLLHNDCATIAVEVPVWAYDKNLGNICGHIDILQVRFGKIWVINFKPGSKNENKEKVASQLFWYSRSRVPRMCSG